MMCFEKGEEFCPLKDDRDILFDKITESDGVIFASPNYCGQVSGAMKTFVDRFGFVCHRPRYFGKVYTSIVTQGIIGGDRIVEYLNTLGLALGFTVVKGSCVTALIPTTEKDRQKIDRTLAEHSRRFYTTLTKAGYPAPTLFQLMLFRVARTMIKRQVGESSFDYRYYADMGWFESDYYYPTRLGALKKLAGRFFDTTAATVQSRLT
jgi:hypothetical protein